MSSATATVNTTDAPAATKPIRSVPRKTTNKRKAAAEDANSASTPVVAAPAIADAETNPAPAEKKKRVSKKNAAAAAAAPAVEAVAEADVASTEAPAVAAAESAPAKKKTTTPRAKKVKAEKVEKNAAESVEAPVSAAAAAPSSNDNESAEDAAASSEKPKKQRVPRGPRPVFIEGYGDEDASNIDYSPEAWAKFKEETQLRLNRQTYAQWKAAKATYYKKAKALLQQKKKARATRTEDKFTTSEKHSQRLLATYTAKDFEVLNGKWLSSYGFDGIIPAATLDAADKTTLPIGALEAYTVYKVAVSHGFKPLGIVSESEKKEKKPEVEGGESSTENKEGDAEEVIYKHKYVVDGERLYVGVALPFRFKEASMFSVISDDRTYITGAAASANASSEDVDTGDATETA